MLNIYTVIMTLSLILAALIVVYAVIRHTVDKSLYLIFLSIANIFFIFGSLLEMTASNLESAFYGVRVQYMGIPYLMPLSYLFCRDLYGKKRFNAWQHIVFLSIPVLSVFAIQVFPATRVFYDRIWYTTNGIVANVAHTSGFLYYASLALNYSSLLLALWLILRQIVSGGRRIRQQSIVLLVGWIGPVITNIFYTMVDRSSGFDLTPVVYVTAVVVFVSLALSGNLLEVLPLARRQVMDELEDAFVVCDEDMCFLDANLSAKRLFPELATLTRGESLECVGGFQSYGELRRWVNGEEIDYKITQTPVLQGKRNSGICIVFQNVTAENRLLENLRHRAEMDTLMDIYNRGAFFDIAHETLKRGRLRKHPCALLMIDLDHFKRMNDSYGHLYGDTVLRAVSATIKNNIRKGDVIGRYGGEEFAVLLEDITEEEAFEAAEKLRKSVESLEMLHEGERVLVTISVGVVHCPLCQSTTLRELLAHADEALYRAKTHGRNQVRMHSSVR